jgi:type IV pilus assembly protein PilW
VRDPIISPDATIIPPLSLSPVQIIDGASNAPDTVTLVYGNSSQLTASVPLLDAYVAGGNKFKVANGFGFAVGDTLVIGQVGRGCNLATLTSTPDPQSEDLYHDPGNYTDPSGGTHTARYNKAGGVATNYDNWSLLTNSGGRVLNLGNSPTVVTYSIQNAQLMATYLLQSATPATIVDGIVQLQAKYGKALHNTNGVVDTWETTSPTNAADWAQVLALQLVIVARSGQPERPTDAKGQPTTGACNTTTLTKNFPVTSIPIDLTADPNWMCYRYRVFETVVPLRNQIWAPA